MADVFSDLWNAMTGKKGREQARGALEGGQQEARRQVNQSFPRARGELRRGVQRARGTFSRGTNRLRTQNASQFGQARGEFTSGIDAARDAYNSPQGQAADAEVANRLAGRGGYSAEMTEQMKANAREEAGTAMRDIKQQTSGFTGNAYTPGQAAESLASAFADVHRRRAGAVRDVDMQNAMLQEDQQTQAIGQTREQNAVIASLNEKRGAGLANMTIQQLQSDQALSQEELQLISGLQAALGRDLSGMTLDKATTLAQMALGGAVQDAGTRDTTNYLADSVAAAFKAYSGGGGEGGGVAGQAKEAGKVAAAG